MRRASTVLGFSMTMAAAVLPLAGVSSWVVLTQWSRWVYTESLFALLILAISLAMLLRGRRARPDDLALARGICLCVIVLAALVVLAGEAYDVWFSFARPEEDDYLSSEMVLGGFFVVVASSTVGLGASLFPTLPNSFSSTRAR